MSSPNQESSAILTRSSETSDHLVINSQTTIFRFEDISDHLIINSIPKQQSSTILTRFEEMRVTPSLHKKNPTLRRIRWGSHHPHCRNRCLAMTSSFEIIVDTSLLFVTCLFFLLIHETGWWRYKSWWLDNAWAKKSLSRAFVFLEVVAEEDGSS